MARIPEQGGATLASRVTNVDGRASELERHTDGWVNVRSYGARGDGQTQDTDAVLAALGAVTSSDHGGTLIFPPGVYLLDSLTLQDLVQTKPISIRGEGQVIWRFSSGVAGLTLGDAEHSAPVRRLTVDNIEIQTQDSSTLTYGMRLLFAVDCLFRNVRVQGGGSITTSLLVSYSWDNEFHHFISNSINGLQVDAQGNRNVFLGGKIESYDDSTGIGLLLAGGAANTFIGLDVESNRYGFQIGPSQATTILGCYLEANRTADVYFDGTGAASGAVISGCWFDVRTHTSTAVKAPPSGAFATGVSIHGNSFVGPPASAFIVLTPQAWYWDVGANSTYGIGASGLVSGASSAHGSRTLQGAVETFGSVRRYQIVPAGTSGTVTIDSVANITAGGSPAHVRVIGSNQDGARDFEFVAVISAAGALASSQIVRNTAGIGSVQVSAGNLQVTTLDLGTYSCFVEARSYVSSV